MSKITAADVKKLRNQTGAGMMDVKKALVEAEGDTEKAIDLLRKQGQKLSVRRAEREAKEGVVIAKVNENKDQGDRKSTRLNSSHVAISYAVFCLKKKKSTN